MLLSLLLQVGSPITELRTVTRCGLFNAHAAGGELIVDGVAASAMHAGVSPDLAHALLCAARLVRALAGSTMMHAINSAYLAFDGNTALAATTALVGHVPSW